MTTEPFGGVGGQDGAPVGELRAGIFAAPTTCRWCGAASIAVVDGEAACRAHLRAELVREAEARERERRTLRGQAVPTEGGGA